MAIMLTHGARNFRVNALVAFLYLSAEFASACFWRLKRLLQGVYCACAIGCFELMGVVLQLFGMAAIQRSVAQ